MSRETNLLVDFGDLNIGEKFLVMSIRRKVGPLYVLTNAPCPRLCKKSGADCFLTQEETMVGAMDRAAYVLPAPSEN